MYFGPRLFKHMNLDANLFQTRLGLRLILRVFPVICYSYDGRKGAIARVRIPRSVPPHVEAY